eukprot:scaffold77695_cov47-Phaeocystis_antarctica.AAC.3
MPSGCKSGTRATILTAGTLPSYHPLDSGYDPYSWWPTLILTLTLTIALTPTLSLTLNLHPYQVAHAATVGAATVGPDPAARHARGAPGP